MFFLVSVPVGMIFGAATWAFIRGRGRFAGLALVVVVHIISAFVGGLAAQAIVRPASSVAILLGTLCGALAAAVVVAIGWGPRPRVVGHSQGRRPAGRGEVI
jgi:hypothetical protein